MYKLLLYHVLSQLEYLRERIFLNIKTLIDQSYTYA